MFLRTDLQVQIGNFQCVLGVFACVFHRHQLADAIAMLTTPSFVFAATSSPTPLASCGTSDTGNNHVRSPRALRQARSSKFSSGTTVGATLPKITPKNRAAAMFCTVRKSCFPCGRRSTRCGTAWATERTSGADAITLMATAVLLYEQPVWWTMLGRMTDVICWIALQGVFAQQACCVARVVSSPRPQPQG